MDDQVCKGEKEAGKAGRVVDFSFSKALNDAESLALYDVREDVRTDACFSQRAEIRRICGGVLVLDTFLA